MNPISDQPVLVLNGIDGGNPLGFLAALGTLRILSDGMGSDAVRLGWMQYEGAWRPTLLVAEHHNLGPEVEQEVSREHAIITALARVLDLPANPIPEFEANQLRDIECNYRQKAKNIVKKRKELRGKGKKDGLSGSELNKYVEESCSNDKKELDLTRQYWLGKLASLALSPELGLGKTLSVTPEELRHLALKVVGAAKPDGRTVSDLVAAFGSEACAADDRIAYTPFCFVTGSGHQYFLETIQELMTRVTKDHLWKTLFRSWKYEDERLSLRWDPQEDRRYALMWHDPTSAGNEVRTMWAANLLAYYGLSFLPSVSSGGRLRTTGFDKESKDFTWPIWETPLTVDSVRSLLSLSDLCRESSDRARLSRMGIVEVYRSARLQVGNPPLVKVNFEVARPV